jgi:hypothetical protein
VLAVSAKLMTATCENAPGRRLSADATPRNRFAMSRGGPRARSKECTGKTDGAGLPALMDQWLSQARDALAEASGVPADRLELDDEAVDVLLELARVAAHESGERTNAPLLCYLVGRTQNGASLDDLADAVRRSTS